MVWERFPEGGSLLLLALKIADISNDHGDNIFPSVATLAEQTRQSERTVQYQLRRLQEIGWLILADEAYGRGHTRRYCISHDWIKGADLAPISKEKGATSAPIREAKGCNPAHERVQPDVEKGATAIAPKPSVTIREPLDTPPTPSAEGAGDERFTSFWSTYPNRKAKQAALKAWKKLKVDDALFTAIMAGLARAMKSHDWLKDGGRFVPHPATWLNGRRWEDEFAAADAAPQTQPAGAGRNNAHDHRENFFGGLYASLESENAGDDVIDAPDPAPVVD